MLLSPAPFPRLPIIFLAFINLAKSLPSPEAPNGPQNGIYFSPDDSPITLPSSPFASSSSFNLTTRDAPDPGIYICSGPNWSGTCFWQSIPPAVYSYCGAVNASAGWDSVGPDKGIVVDIYKNISCTADGLLKKQVIWPGRPDLKSDGIPNAPSLATSAAFGVKVLKYTGGYSS